MGLKIYVESMAAIWVIVMGVGSGDLSQDKTECESQLVGLSPCLSYVGGDAKQPTIDCCTGLKQVLGKSQKCLCILIKDRNDPNLGIKINGTLAATLPATCHAPANVTDCINILHLPPNSTDAKIFKEFANITSSGKTTSASIPSGNSSASGRASTAPEKSGANWIWTSNMPSILHILIFAFLLLNATSFVFW